MKNYKWAPFLQTDSRWRNEIMWEKESVERVAINELKTSTRNASKLIYSFPVGNVIGTEGCLLCSLAMVLKLLDDYTEISWTPKKLNTIAQEELFYTKCCFSTVRLYSDICSELTDGYVQMCAKEEYPFAHGLSRKRIYPSQSKLLQKYLSIPGGHPKSPSRGHLKIPQLNA